MFSAKRLILYKNEGQVDIEQILSYLYCQCFTKENKKLMKL